MREEITVTYIAEDGTQFNTDLSCLAYERFEEMLRIYTTQTRGVSFSTYTDCAVFLTWLHTYKSPRKEFFNVHEYLRQYPNIWKKKCRFKIDRNGSVTHKVL